MEDKYIVYIKVDEQNRVVEINSSDFISDLTGWIKIDEGLGDKYHHAQGNYLPYSLMAELGVYRYKFVNGSVVERTADELSGDILPVETQPTETDRIAALEAAMLAIMG